MSDYIKREDAKRAIRSNFHDFGTRCMINNIINEVAKVSSNNLVEVVRCKDCKHRPKKVGNEGNGFDYEFSEEYACPGYCEDGYYAELFDDSFYCAWGER